MGDVRKLISSSSESRVVISTRSLKLANEAGRSIQFGCLIPKSVEARKILFSWGLGNDNIQKGCWWKL